MSMETVTLLESAVEDRQASQHDATKPVTFIALGCEDSASVVTTKTTDDALPVNCGARFEEDIIQDSDSLTSEVKGTGWPEYIPSVWDLYIQATERFPDALAIASIHQKGNVLGLPNLVLDHDEYRAQPYVRWSYSQFARGVTHLIKVLQKFGAREGCPVFTFLDNCAEFPIIFWAAVSVGCTFVPLHPRNLLNKEEATHIVDKVVSTSHHTGAVIFAQNAALAAQVLDVPALRESHVIILDSAQHDGPWHSLGALVADGQVEDTITLTQYSASARQWSIILFTSGTTALPKGVLLEAVKIDRWMEGRRQTVSFTTKDSTLLILPNNHTFYFLSELAMRGCGGATVLPAPSFSPQIVPGVMALEKCTLFPMPPTVVYAIAQIVGATGTRLNTLRLISTGTAKLSVEFLNMCIDDIGATGIEIMYGSTEGGAICSTGIVTRVSDIMQDGDVAVGRPATGSIIKVCAPGKRVPLPRNTEGELHYTSITRSDGYIGGEHPETFYTDEQGQHWFVTGDAGTISDEGLVFIVGRIKDMIIRGGENISPAAIEFVLSRDPQTINFNVQVVGRSDSIAGEVPVAVSQLPVTARDVESIKHIVVSKMGKAYLLEDILTLEELGLNDFPKTMLGKVQKIKLKEAVRQYLDKQDIAHSIQSEDLHRVVDTTHTDDREPKTSVTEQILDGDEAVLEPSSLQIATGADQNLSAPNTDSIKTPVDELVSSVQKVWKRTIGHEVDIKSQISDFADSITVMRIQERYRRDLGAKIPLATMLEAKTVSGQIKLIRETTKMRKSPSRSHKQATPSLTYHDLVHLAADPKWFPSTQAWISDQIGKSGLAWEDLREITPASDFIQVLTQADILNTSWSWKFAFLARPGITKATLRAGIEVMLTHNPILASFLFWNQDAFGSDIALHVMPKPTQKVFDCVFRDYGSIPTKEDFAKLVFEPYEYEMAELPGILAQFLLFDIGDTGRSGTIMVAHHASMDASYMQLLFDDLDKGLGGASTLEEHVSYKTWADSYYSLRTSYEAQIAVAWHTSRLHDLTSKRRSVFPPLPRPHHFSKQSQHIQSINDNGCHTTFRVVGITALRQKHPNLSAPIIIKAAWALMNMHHNGTFCAIFSNLQADRRRFPFIPKCLELLSPSHTFEASNVAGPTLQDVVNIIPLHTEESVLDFMYRVAHDQEELNAFAAAPLKSIMEQIGPINSEIMLDILRSQIFNWTPGLGAMETHNSNENYEPLASFIRPSLRLVINVDVGGSDNETAFVQVKSPLYDMDGLQGIANDVEDFALWLCDETNWQKRAGDFKTALRQTPKTEVQVNGVGL